APFDAQCDALQIRTCRLVQYIGLPSGFGGSTLPPGDVCERVTGDHARAAGNASALVDFKASVRPRFERVGRADTDALVLPTVQADIAIVQGWYQRSGIHVPVQQVRRLWMQHV